jgi:CheY-like chemotaxis protein
MGVVPQLAGTTDQAINALATKTFDLVLADYNLGAGNGIDLLKTAIRQSRPGKPFPVFHLVTSYDIAGIQEYAVRTGYTGVHRKPLNFSEIYEILSSADATRIPASNLASL